jgi:hypothetical protein
VEDGVGFEEERLSGGRYFAGSEEVNSPVDAIKSKNGETASSLCSTTSCGGY